MTTDSVPVSGSFRNASQFRASREAEARLLLLIDGFSRERNGLRSLQGRVKLAKLDFLLRYPAHLAKILGDRGAPESAAADLISQDSPLESRMMRYRYGPWDPSHFAVLGSLIGRGLVVMVPAAGTSAIGYRTTEAGAELVAALTEDGAFDDVIDRVALLRRYLDLTGENLKRILYGIPEIANASWHQELR